MVDDFGSALSFSNMRICVTSTSAWPASELCDINERTWYRWIKDGAPRWAIRLVMSKRGSLNHLDWKDWENDGGCLYYRQLQYRYYRTPARLRVPLFNIKDSDIT
jgi:hypothetical protein